jgi:hypothetical protein
MNQLQMDPEDSVKYLEQIFLRYEDFFVETPGVQGYTADNA